IHAPPKLFASVCSATRWLNAQIRRLRFAFGEAPVTEKALPGSRHGIACTERAVPNFFSLSSHQVSTFVLLVGRGGGSNRHLYVIRRHGAPSCVCVVKQRCCIISCIDIGTCTYVLCCNGCPRFSFVRIFLTRGSNTTSRGVVLSVASIVTSVFQHVVGSVNSSSVLLF
ncbi:unnamed protein product, partial [Ectocarpus sp. 8 AP-2014]